MAFAFRNAARFGALVAAPVAAWLLSASLCGPAPTDATYRRLPSHVASTCRSRQTPSTARKKAKLEKVTGPNFDVAYIDEQVTDHQKATLAIQHQIDGGQDRDVRQLAIDTLPVVTHHLETARRLQAKLKGIVPAPAREPGG